MEICRMAIVWIIVRTRNKIALVPPSLTTIISANQASTFGAAYLDIFSYFIKRIFVYIQDVA